MEIKKIISILNIIKRCGYEAYLVGGSARDFIYGRDFTDIDIATNCPLDVISSKFGIEDDKGKAFGSIKIKYANIIAEITRFRIETYEDGNTFPKVSFVNKAEDDVKRRDFTVNAIYLDVDKNKVIDPTDGMHDLYNHLLKFIGDPKTRIKEDPTRIIRGLRIAYKLNLDIDKETDDAFKENIKELDRLSSSRYKKEMTLMYNDLGINKTKKIIEEYKMEDIDYECKENI